MAREPARVSIKLSLIVGAVLSVAVLATIWLIRSDPRDLELQRLKEAIARLEAERRIAQVVVVEQNVGANGRIRTKFRFAETAADVLEFEIEGDIAYFDALVVKFEREYTKLGDGLRGKSLYLFRRAFGEFQKPDDGFPLDRDVPVAYRLEKSPSEFEKEIWADFWALALDPKMAKSRGVRVAHGEAVYTKLVPGKLYHLTIENAGGLSIRVEDAPALNEPTSKE